MNTVFTCNVDHREEQKSQGTSFIRTQPLTSNRASELDQHAIAIQPPHEVSKLVRI
jgi:hypothetical protein